MSTQTIEPFGAIKSARTLSKGQQDPEFKAVQTFLERFGYLLPRAYKENQLDRVEIGERPEHQACADQQHQCRGDLQHDERVAESPHRSADAPASVLLQYLRR